MIFIMKKNQKNLKKKNILKKIYQPLNGKKLNHISKIYSQEKKYNH